MEISFSNGDDEQLREGMRFINNFIHTAQQMYTSNNMYNQINSQYNHLSGMPSISFSINHSRPSSRFGLSRYLSLERVLYDTRYEKEEYELAEIIFFELRNEWKEKNNIIEINDVDRDREISVSIKNILLDFYNSGNVNSSTNIEEERFPNLEEFIEKLYAFKCDCLIQYESENLKKVIEHYCLLYGKYPSCNTIPYILEFYIIQKRVPTQEELEDLVYRTIQFSLNPEEYHQRDKEFIPTIGVDKLPIFIYKDFIEKHSSKDNKLCQNTCAIGQDDFLEKQSIMKLVPCGHLFHSTNSECLENASIRNWLEKYNYCPLCKQKIKID
jgi:hypothetical protein